MKTETERTEQLTAKGIRESFCNAFCDGDSKTCMKNCMMRLLNTRTISSFKISDLLAVKR